MEEGLADGALSGGLVLGAGVGPGFPESTAVGMLLDTSLGNKEGVVLGAELGGKL